VTDRATRLWSQAGQVDLWMVFTADLQPSLLGRYRRLLDESEREQERRFVFLEDRERYVVTRALARIALSRYCDVSPAEWHFGKTKYGRPVILNEDAAAARLTFNISHTRGLVVLAVTRENELGVDVEHVNARHAILSIAERYFAPDELHDLSALPEAARQERFFELWTLKEAYAKARGMGLSLPLDQFAFDLTTPGRVAVSFAPALGDSPSRYRFWQLGPSDEFMVAVCAGVSNVSAPQLLVRRVVPLRSEQVGLVPLRRCSP
jgi:4'-phosphopantetheinyl transferase